MRHPGVHMFRVAGEGRMDRWLQHKYIRNLCPCAQFLILSKVFFWTAATITTGRTLDHLSPPDGC